MGPPRHVTTAPDGARGGPTWIAVPTAVGCSPRIGKRAGSGGQRLRGRRCRCNLQLLPGLESGTDG